MKKIISNHIISSYLLTIFFLVHGYEEYGEFIGWTNCLIMAFFYTSIVFLSFIVLRRYFNDTRKASLLNIVLFTFFFFFSAFHNVLKSTFPDQIISKYIFLIPLITISIFIFIRILIKRRAVSIRIFRYVNLCLLLFILFDFVHIGLSLTGYDHSKKLTDPESRSYQSMIHRPSIYLLVFDEYASSRSLKKSYGYNNELDSILIKKGFHIFNSRSNYNFTHFSIGSMLNQNYLTFSMDTNRISYNDYMQAEKCIYNNSTGQYLESQGYTIRNLSIFDWRNHPALQSYYLFPSGTLLLRNRTFFLYVYQHLGWHLTTMNLPFLNQFEKKIYSVLSYNKHVEDELIKYAVNKENRPQFVYAHFMMPHPPFFFQKDGSLRPKEEVLNDEKHHIYPIDKYLDNVHYTNRKIETLVSFIQEKESGNAIIVIVGDHGFRQNNPSREEYFSNFNAVYFPASLRPVKYPASISLVNQFRFIFNQCSSQNMPYIQDKQYFLKDAEPE